MFGAVLLLPSGIIPEKTMEVMAATTHADVLGNLQNQFARTDQRPYSDLGLMEAFQEQPAIPGQDFVDVLDTKNNITFEKMADGESLKFYKIGAGSSQYKLSQYGAGIEITDRAIEFNKWKSSTNGH